ncbi:hypothetical protein [Bradyrhizobium sp. Leo121]|uniref:tetratricopeptide repeat protein n=1 Tax=Bradyrhizobium sp. Leo121 TaxID=1571195 RepID=UPI00102A3B8B|nr:hypothetical protein [Bradyrhizobium sp. Leo121]
MLALSGQAYSYVLEEPEKGEALCASAIALDPNSVLARNWKGWTNIYLGNDDAAIEQFSAAIRLSPLDPRLFLIQTWMAYAHFFAGWYEDGLSWATSAIQSQSNFPRDRGHEWRGILGQYRRQGRIAESHDIHPDVTAISEAKTP